MATYVNDLRLKEIATGDEAGTWGTSTNTNLELIAEAFSFGTEAITTNADTHTTTIADGSTDPGRSLFLKYTGTLDSACTITIGPNTVSKLWLIENATSGSQNIIIKQGSGATVTIANGQTKAIYSDGAGSGGAMVDAFQDLSIPDLFVDDDLTIGDDLVFSSDSAVITFGADGDTTLTHTDGSGLTLNSTNKLMFNDASQFIQGSSATVLSLGATDEIDLTATTIDINGAADVSGNVTIGGDVIAADFDVDASGDINLDAGGGDWRLKDDGTTIATISNVSGDLQILLGQDQDYKFQIDDNGAQSTALLLDGSEGGIATFGSGINIGNRGSASDPTLQSSIDPDTGVFWGGSNILGFASGGSEKLRVSANGVEQADGDFLYNGGGNFDIKHTTAGQNIVFSTTPSGGSTAEVLRITSDGDFAKLSGSLTIDVAGNIKLDADDNGEVRFLDGGTQFATIKKDGNNALFQSIVADGDFLIQGIDGSSFVTAATFDMSEGGAATFRGNMTMNGLTGTSPILHLVNNDTEDVNTGRESSVRFNGFRSGGEAVINSQISGNHTSSADDDKGGLFFYTNGGAGLGERMRITSNEIIVNEDGGDQDFRIESQASTLGISLDASTGHVSMGVTNATTTYGGTFRLLQIGNGAGYGIFNGLTSATANDAGVASFFGQTSGTSGYDVVGGMRIALAADSSSNSEGKIEFYTATGGNLVEAMEITNSQQLILHGVKDDTTSDAANMNIRSSDGLVRRSTSSRRYKNNITDATHGLTELLKLRSVTYKGNNDGDRLFGGLIAEEVHDAGLTEFVQYNSDDEPDALAYGHMVSLCVKAIQEQQALIEALQAEIAALKGE